MRPEADTGLGSSAFDRAEITELPFGGVRSSTGQPADPIFVATTLHLAEIERKIVVSLVARKRMIHRLHLGRKALGNDLFVNSSVDHRAIPKRRKKTQHFCLKLGQAVCD